MKLFLVDDDELILKSLSIMLDREEDIQVLGTANNGAQAVEVCAKLQPDVVLMDIRMPKMDGIAATRRIKEDFPNVRIMMLTTFDDRPNIEEALAAGADGYLLKTDEVSTIADKLRPLIAGVAAGVSVLDAEVLKTLSASERSDLSELTQREKDITRLVAQGLSNKEIAAQLFLSEGTVRNNIANIMEKLHLKNRTQLGMAYYGK
jgi:DNA-binding NarL/FixJ family response regulator